MNTIRIDKFIANNGYVARRDVDVFLKTHVVTLDGERIFEPGIRFDPKIQKLLIDNKKIRQPEKMYIALNKPVGILSTASDERGRKTVLDFVETKERLFPVGRLDKDTTGLILLTNDGELMNKLIHPRYHIPKTYELTIQGMVSKTKQDAFRNGVILEDGKTQPAQITKVKTEHGQTTITLILFEGKKRQIRRMCEVLNIPLLYLNRIAIGPITLGKLALGEFRNLTTEEIEKLKNVTK